MDEDFFSESVRTPEDDAKLNEPQIMKKKRGRHPKTCDCEKCKLKKL